MIFEDIKPGDSVLLEELVHENGWGSPSGYLIPKKVTRVTDKQFRVGMLKFRKEDGRQIGGGPLAYKEGQEISFYEVATDQTEEYKAAKLRLSQHSRLKIICNVLSNTKPVDLKTVDSYELHKLLDSLEHIYNTMVGEDS